MELRHLRYFCSVVEWNGFSNAARRLHVSQSSVSEQIRDLEREIGVPLFVRSRGSIRLTPEGEAFHLEAKEVLARAQRAVEMARRSGRGEIGAVSIGFIAAATSTFIPEIIREYRQRYPGVRLSLFEMSPHQQMEALSDGSIDIGFSRAIEPPYDEIIQSECLHRDPLLAVLPASHRLAPGPVAVEDLAHERFLMFQRDAWPGLFDTVLSICRNAGFSPQIVNSSLMMQTLLTLVGAEEGVSILPASIRHFRANSVVYCRLKPDTERVKLVLAYRDGPQGAAQNAFLDLVRERKQQIKNLMQGSFK